MTVASEPFNMLNYIAQPSFPSSSHVDFSEVGLLDIIIAGELRFLATDPAFYHCGFVVVLLSQMFQALQSSDYTTKALSDCAVYSRHSGIVPQAIKAVIVDL